MSGVLKMYAYIHIIKNTKEKRTGSQFQFRIDSGNYIAKKSITHYESRF